MEVSGKQIGAMAGKPATLLLPRRAARRANDASSRQAPVAAGRPRCGDVEKKTITVLDEKI